LARWKRSPRVVITLFAFCTLREGQVRVVQTARLSASGAAGAGTFVRSERYSLLEKGSSKVESG